MTPFYQLQTAFAAFINFGSFDSYCKSGLDEWKTYRQSQPMHKMFNIGKWSLCQWQRLDLSPIKSARVYISGGGKGLSWMRVLAGYSGHQTAFSCYWRLLFKLTLHLCLLLAWCTTILLSTETWLLPSRCWNLFQTELNWPSWIHIIWGPLREY